MVLHDGEFFDTIIMRGVLMNMFENTWRVLINYDTIILWGYKITKSLNDPPMRVIE